MVQSERCYPVLATAHTHVTESTSRRIELRFVILLITRSTNMVRILIFHK